MTILGLDDELVLVVLLRLSGRDLGRLQCAHPYFFRPAPRGQGKQSLAARAAELALSRRRDAWRVSKRPDCSESCLFLLHVLEQLAPGRLGAAGPECTLAIDCDGRVHSWGVDTHGQLGHDDGRGAQIAEPRPISQLAEEELACVALRHKHAAAITTRGVLYTWGVGSAGALGNAPGTLDGASQTILHRTYVRTTPEPVVLPGAPDSRVVLVAVGDSHTACLTDDGAVFTWGYAQQGALGHGGGCGPVTAQHSKIVHKPTRVETLSAVGRFIDISCGGQTTAAVSATGRLFMWGTCVNPHTTSLDDEQRDRTVQIPEQVTGFVVDTSSDTADSPIQEAKTEQDSKEVRVRSVSCGRYHFAAVGTWSVPSTACAKRLAGHRMRTVAGIWTWGDGGDGQLGHGSHVRRAPTPRLISTDACRERSGESCLYTGGGGGSRLPSDVWQVSCGESHTCCITASGAMYVWGSNLDGQLGTGDRADRFYPALIDNNFGRVLDASCGNQHTVIRTERAVLTAGDDRSRGSGSSISDGYADRNYNHPVLRLGESRIV